MFSMMGFSCRRWELHLLLVGVNTQVSQRASPGYPDGRCLITETNPLSVVVKIRLISRHFGVAIQRQYKVNNIQLLITKPSIGSLVSH